MSTIRFPRKAFADSMEINSASLMRGSKYRAMVVCPTFPEKLMMAAFMPFAS